MWRWGSEGGGSRGRVVVGGGVERVGVGGGERGGMVLVGCNAWLLIF